MRPRDSFIQPMSLDAVKGGLDNPEQLRAVGPQIEERQETVADFLQIYLINTGESYAIRSRPQCHVPWLILEIRSLGWVRFRFRYHNIK